MIIGLDRMVQLFLLDDFKRQLIQLDGATLPMKEPIYLLGKTDLTSHEMRELAMKTEEQVSTKEATERLKKIIDSTYTKSDREQVAANTTHMND